MSIGIDYLSNMDSKYIRWVKRNSKYLYIKEIETAIGCPEATIHRWLNDKRDLPGKWVDKLEEWVKTFRALK